MDQIKKIIQVVGIIIIINMLINFFLSFRQIFDNPYLMEDPNVFAGIVTQAVASFIIALVPIIIIWRIFSSVAKGKASANTLVENIQSRISGNSATEFNFKKTVFKYLVSPNASNPEAILTELDRFKSIKEKHEVQPGVLDLVVIHKDNSEHRYRAHIEGNKWNFKIKQLSRYS